MSLRRGSLLQFLLALLPATLGAAVPPVHPVHPVHPGPSIWGEITLRESDLVLLIEGAADPLTTNLGLERLLIGPLEPAEEARARAGVLDFCNRKLKVELDDVAVPPELTELIIQDGLPEDGSWRSARFVLSYPYERQPRKLSITWPGFEGEGVDFIPIVIRVGEGGRPRMFSLYEEEPQFIWHASDVRPRERRVITRQVGEARGLAPTVPAILLLCAVLVILLYRRLRGAAWPESAATAVLGLLGALALSISSGVRLPPPDEQLRIFGELHQNVYDAFSADTEDGIYDLLQTSVEASLLDDLYGEIYESLILREQGGAICGIDAVEPLDGSLVSSSGDDPDTPGRRPEFLVDWSWRVHGTVSHWGHIHRRTNQYRAEYTVAHDGESWKIAAVSVLSHERTDDD